MKFFFTFILFCIFGFCLIVGCVLFMMRPTGELAEEVLFAIPINNSNFHIAQELVEKKIIWNSYIFERLVSYRKIKHQPAPGGYMLNRGMHVFEVVRFLYEQEPDYIWVRVKEGMRREEIGELLALTFDWEKNIFDQWNTLPMKEGAFFPDTYLFHKNAVPQTIAQKMVERFDQVTAQYKKEAVRKQIPMDTIIILASLIEREGVGLQDMPIISGIIWNRLRIDMRLQIDATLQYVNGNTEDGWWSVPTPALKRIDSPYNTYLYAGLPPTAIANPGEEAIKAAVYPQKTDCLFYLHDRNRKMHCAKTYEEHKDNIDKYLRG